MCRMSVVYVSVHFCVVAEYDQLVQLLNKPQPGALALLFSVHHAEGAYCSVCTGHLSSCSLCTGKTPWLVEHAGNGTP